MSIWPNCASRRDAWSSVTIARAAGSVPKPLVDQVEQRLPVAEAAQVLQEDGHGGGLPARGVVGGVRREEHALHAPEGMVRRQRLLLEHVEGGAAKPALIERGQQRRLVHDGAAAN